MCKIHYLYFLKSCGANKLDELEILEASGGLVYKYQSVVCNLTSLISPSVQAIAKRLYGKIAVDSPLFTS